MVCLLLCATATACSDKPPEDTATTTETTSATGSSSGSTTMTPTTGAPTTDPTATDTSGSGSATGSESSGTTGPAAETSSTGDPTTSGTSETSGTSDTGVMVACDKDGTSNLDGVCIVFLPQETSFTVVEAQAGVEFKYVVVVTGDVADVTPLPNGTCDTPGPSGLYVGERVEGDGQSYCVCDQGKCPPPDDPPFVLKAGQYPDSLAWDGVNWNGPSDFNQPKGPPFPPGMYTVKLRATGVHQGQDFEVTAELPITLTP